MSFFKIFNPFFLRTKVSNNQFCFFGIVPKVWCKGLFLFVGYLDKFGIDVKDTSSTHQDVLPVSYTHLDVYKRQDLITILAGVIAAIIWNLLTWWKGIPSSSSHTLIGGFAGAAIAHGLSSVTDPEHAGFKIVNWFKAAKEGELMPSGVLIVILFIVFAPLLLSLIHI